MKRETKIVGILNITPDSFSDGGNYINPKAALLQAEKMVEAGVDIVDIGAESTRPNAISLTHEEEWDRLKDVLPSLKKLAPTIKLSIDTFHPETALKAIDVGIDWLNDVSGCNDPAMVRVAANSNVHIVIMHNLGVPVNPKITIPENEDVAKVVYKWAEQKINQLKQAGIATERIIFDPGIGFGKTAQQSLELIKDIEQFKQLGVEILVGHSRKSFLTLFTSEHASNRDIETYIFSGYLATKHIDYIRVHDVYGNKRAIRVTESLFGKN